MVIDSHQHFWRYDPVQYDWIDDEMKVLKRDFLPSDLHPVLQKNSIDGCISVQASQTDAETEFLLSLARKFEFIKGVVGWVDLQSADLDERLGYYSRSEKLSGFRHVLQSEAPGFMTNPRFVEGVNRLSSYGFTYDLLIYHFQMDEAVKFLSRTEGVKVVIDHLAKPSIRTAEKLSWAKHMAAASAFKNVCCKLSGMFTEASWKNWKKEDFYPYMDVLMETFGPQRIMYGSDWPVCLVAVDYDQQLSIVKEYIDALSPEEKAAIMGLNAKRFYNLE